MRSSLTANEDHPGPTARRQSATGGDAVQSVLICTSWITPSRWGPRKPDQSARVSALGAAMATSLEADFGSDAFPAIVFSAIVAALSGIVTAGTGSSCGDSATKRSSGVGVHRQCKSLVKLPVMPPIRRRVHAPHARRIVATIVTRRIVSERWRVATAHATSATPSGGRAITKNTKPPAPWDIDLSTKGRVPYNPATITTIAPIRSTNGAR